MHGIDECPCHTFSIELLATKLQGCAFFICFNSSAVGFNSLPGIASFFSLIFLPFSDFHKSRGNCLTSTQQLFPSTSPDLLAILSKKRQ